MPINVRPAAPLDKAVAVASAPATVETEPKSLAVNAAAEVLEPDDNNVVDFVDGDPDDPLNWPYWRKLSIQLLVAMMGFLANFGTIVIVPAVPQILADFAVDDDLYLALLVSIWELGEGIGPFLVGPLSEKYGRLPVYHGGNVLFIIFSITSAVSSNISMLVASRLLTGFAGTSLTLGPSIVGDCFPREERGKSMAVAIAIPMIGPFVSPVIGGYVADRLGWRWTVWLTVIVAGVVSLVSVLIFRETYKVVILERRAKRLRRETGSQLLRSRYQKTSDANTVARSFTRPVRLLFSSPIVFIVSVYMALVYGLSFLILTTLTPIMQGIYGFSEGTVGLTFLGRAIGNIVAIGWYALTSDRYLKYMRRKRGQSQPEDRLPNMLLGAILIVAGIFIYGWTAELQAPWIAPIISTAVIGFSMLLVVLPTENYVVDVFELDSASAIVAGVIWRAYFGALFPLVGPPLYNRLGLGWGNSLLGFIFAAWIPPLLALTFYGSKLRQNGRNRITGAKAHHEDNGT